MRPVVGYLIGDTAFIPLAVFTAVLAGGSGSAARGASRRQAWAAAARVLPAAMLPHKGVLSAQGGIGS